MESALQDGEPNLKGALVTSLQPLRVSSSLSHPPRPPTLEESQAIVRRLYSALSLQSQEVSAALSDGVGLSWTFLMTWCPADGACQGSAEGRGAQQEDHCGELPLDQSLPRR